MLRMLSQGYGMYEIFGKMAPVVRDMTAGFDLGAGMISKSTTDF